MKYIPFERGSRRESEGHSASHCRRLLVYIDRGNDVFRSDTRAVKDSDLVVRGSPRFPAGNDLGEFSVDRIGRDSASRDRMMQVADSSALSAAVGDYLRLTKESRIKLLFVLVIGADSRDERSRPYICRSYESFVCRRA